MPLLLVLTGKGKPWSKFKTRVDPGIRLRGFHQKARILRNTSAAPRSNQNLCQEIKRIPSNESIAGRGGGGTLLLPDQLSRWWMSPAKLQRLGVRRNQNESKSHVWGPPNKTRLYGGKVEIHGKKLELTRESEVDKVR